MSEPLLKFRYLKDTSNIMRVKMHGANYGGNTFYISEEDGLFFASKAEFNKGRLRVFGSFSDAQAWCEARAREILEKAK